MDDKEPYSGRSMELGAKTLEDMDEIDRYPRDRRLMEMLSLNAHMNFHLMSGIYQELVELRMTIEKANKNAQGT